MKFTTQTRIEIETKKSDASPRLAILMIDGEGTLLTAQDIDRLIEALQAARPGGL